MVPISGGQAAVGKDGVRLSYSKFSQAWSIGGTLGLSTFQQASSISSLNLKVGYSHDYAAFAKNANLNVEIIDRTKNLTSSDSVLRNQINAIGNNNPSSPRRLLDSVVTLLQLKLPNNVKDIVEYRSQLESMIDRDDHLFSGDFAGSADGYTWGSFRVSPQNVVYFDRQNREVREAQFTNMSLEVNHLYKRNQSFALEFALSISRETNALTLGDTVLSVRNAPVPETDSSGEVNRVEQVTAVKSEPQGLNSIRGWVTCAWTPFNEIVMSVSGNIGGEISSKSNLHWTLLGSFGLRLSRTQQPFLTLSYEIGSLGVGQSYDRFSWNFAYPL